MCWHCCCCFRLEFIAPQSAGPLDTSNKNLMGIEENHDLTLVAAGRVLGCFSGRVFGHWNSRGDLVVFLPSCARLSLQAGVNQQPPPVGDDAVKVVLGMNQKHILLCPKFFVFSTSSLPQSFSLLPTSLPPTSPLLFTSPLLPPLSYLQPTPPSYLLHLILCSLHHQRVLERLE
jgi:hypothetical protein